MVIQTPVPVCQGLEHVRLDRIRAEMMGIASLNPSYKRKLRPGGVGWVERSDTHRGWCGNVL
jgi:hypothetical protein